VWLERPYYKGGRINTEISENSFINLLTVKSISFTKGLVLKKHLITKKLANNDFNDDEEDDNNETEILGGREMSEK
jgi:hypothetical protein